MLTNSVRHTNRYTAHPICKHPNQNTPPGDDWSQHVEFVPCNDASLAARHVRDSHEDPYCKHPPWQADADWNLDPFCSSCELGPDGESTNSAVLMYADFETRRDQWEYNGGLSAEETHAINDNIDELKSQYDSETDRGPHNNSYFLLQELLDRYIADWDGYVNSKLESEQQRAQEREVDEAFRQARQESRVYDAAETSIYAAGMRAQLAAPGYASSSGGHQGSSSHSHYQTEPHDRLPKPWNEMNILQRMKYQRKWKKEKKR